MKKSVSLLMLFISMLISSAASAQTDDGTKWISLGDYLSGSYRLNEDTHTYEPDDENRRERLSNLLSSEGSRYDKILGNSVKDYIRASRYLSDENAGLDRLFGKYLYEYLFVSKIAFKKMDGSTGRGKLNLKPIDLSEDGSRHLLGPDVTVSGSFDVKVGDKKTKSKEIEENAEGWKVVEFPMAMVIMGISDISYSDDKAILKNIYVATDDDKDYFAKLAASITDKANKAAAEEREKEINAAFSTPEKKGWTPVKTEKLADGTICNHYAEGYRFYQKPNGDFLTMRECKDIRDEKTLDLTKGIDREMPDDADDIEGAYRVTLNNGVRLASSGLSDTVVFVNGDRLISLRERGRSQQNGDTYEMWEPSLLFDFSVFKTGIGDFRSKTDYTTFYYVKNGSERASKLEGLNHLKTTIEGVQLIVDYDENGMRQYGLRTQYWPDIHLSEYIVKRDAISDYKDGIVYFENGDYIANDKVMDMKLTLNDGTVLEYIPDVDKYRIKYPNGDLFVGLLTSDWYIQLGKFQEGGGEYRPFYSGTFTTGGKEYTYSRGRSDAEEEARFKARYNSLCAKYGAANVDNAMAMKFKVGMKIQMLKDMNVNLIEQGSSTLGSWYKVMVDISSGLKPVYQHLFVDNTGKIVRIL